MRYSVVLISQPGAIPWLLKKITRSPWNHVGLIDDSGLIRDLDWSGPGTYRMEDRPTWKFLVLPLDVTCSWLSRVHSLYKYKLTQNLNWLFAQLGSSRSVYESESPKKNCVGLVADVFRFPHWAALAPGEFERRHFHGVLECTADCRQADR
jgi:hypothetical protein